MADLDAMEQALLDDPFNAGLRCEYATALRTAGRADAAQKQFEIVLKADGGNVRAAVGLALCKHDQGRDDEAVDQYRRARSMDGFEPDETLERLLGKAQPGGPRLAVIEGGGADVLPIRRTDDSKIGFADVAGMEALKKVLRLQIIEPFRNPTLFQRFRKKAGGGVLLYGPPGCGKTLIARAIAGECDADFQAVGISDVLNMWIGESERNLAGIFDQARARRPCVLFFDELDALAYSRSKAASSAARTVVNEFLAQLDGFADANEGVLVLAATNMPWDVDPAMKRPGRFAKQVFVPPPDAEARAEMFRLKLKDVPAEAMEFDALAEATELFSGADIDGLIDLAKERVLSDILDSGRERELGGEDLVAALDEMTPSTLEWLKTAHNLVKFSGADSSYRDVAKYLKTIRRL
ncbi:MAG: AAA family ATPase [Woeseiaceae bacterium]|nr:AAA family ATPase [Woeseiaceae bacterium]